MNFGSCLLSDFILPGTHVMILHSSCGFQLQLNLSRNTVIYMPSEVILPEILNRFKSNGSQPMGHNPFIPKIIYIRIHSNSKITIMK